MSKTTEEQYNSVIQACKDIFEKKNKDYDTAWRILRLPSFTDQIMIKARRIRTIQGKPKRVQEGIVDELVGIVNYTLLALIQASLAEDKRLNIPYDELDKRYDDASEGIMRLLANKNHDYGEAWRDMRVSSMVDIILMKLLRIKKIEENGGKTLISEGIKEGYRDIVNYAVFSLIQLSYPH